MYNVWKVVTLFSVQLNQSGMCACMHEANTVICWLIAVFHKKLNQMQLCDQLCHFTEVPMSYKSPLCETQTSF